MAGGLLAALATWAAPAVESATTPAQGIAAAIEGARSALQRGDARALAAFYTQDADLMGMVSLRGRDAVEQHMAEIIAQGIHDARFEEQEIFPGAAYTVETGRASFYDRQGTRIAVTRYMTLWKQEGGGWKVHRDVSFPVAFDPAAVAKLSASAVAKLAANGGFAVKQAPPVHAIVLPVTGSYSKHGEAIGRLAVWLKAANVAPSGPAFGRYLNSPEQVPEESLQWEVGFPVPAGTEAQPPFESKDIEDGTVVTATVGGPHDTTPRPWAELVDWAQRHGYQVGGPAMEIWQPGPKTEMRLAVRK
jgi:uncharacterized protein (TIGR02246 family)